jgi:hypothetical protein
MNAGTLLCPADGQRPDQQSRDENGTPPESGLHGPEEYPNRSLLRVGVRADTSNQVHLRVTLRNSLQAGQHRGRGFRLQADILKREETAMRARLTLIVVALAIGGVWTRGTPAVAAPQEARAASTSHADEPTLLLGTWRLNVAKSRYTPGPPLREETRIYTRRPEGIIGVVTRTYADGRMERYEYNANFGGERMVTGNPEYDAVTLRKIDEYTSAVTMTHAGAVYGVGRRQVSTDGKTLTLTFDRQNTDNAVHNVAVYDKQP